MGSIVTLKAADGFSLSAYTAGSADAKAGLVVVQEIFGVNHHMRDMADRFAAAGYYACAPAIFDRAERGVELGYTPDDIAKGRDYRMKLTDAQVTADIEAAAALEISVGALESLLARGRRALKESLADLSPAGHAG